MLAVTLREVTADTVGAVCRLAVKPEQQGNVAPNAVSIAQAYFAPEAWFRAVMRGDELAGFVMLHDGGRTPGHPPGTVPEVELWRFMIDARFQGQGIGRAALQCVVAHLRDTYPRLETLRTSCVPGPASPKPFYEGFGFKATGEWDGGEEVLALVLEGAR